MKGTGRRRRYAAGIACGKRRFRDEREALRALHAIQNRERRQRTPIRVYECPRCKGWHLTSEAAR